MLQCAFDHLYVLCGTTIIIISFLNQLAPFYISSLVKQYVPSRSLRFAKVSFCCSSWDKAPSTRAIFMTIFSLLM